jgi:hypothetical protein
MSTPEDRPTFAADFPRRLEELDERLDAARERLGAVTQRLEASPRSAPADGAAGPHLLFVPTPGGYELVDADGPIPGPGETVEVPGRSELRHRVAKVTRSPLPDDGRACVYLQLE